MDMTMKERIRAILRETGTDALLISDPYNMRYISGFRGGEGMLFLSAEEEVLITDSRYTEAAEKETDFTVMKESGSDTCHAIIRRLLQKTMASRVGYEDRFLRCNEFAELRKALPDSIFWKALGDRLQVMRYVKSEKEIELLAKAEAIGDAAFTDILGILRPGMTEKQVAAELEYHMMLHGAEGKSFDTIVASGVHSSMPHAIPTDKPIETGDFVTMDFGCMVDGYCSDMTRTVVVGRADERQKEIYAIVLEAQENCLKNLRAGMTGSEGDALSRDVIRKAGYAEFFGHGTGHSVGLEIHEEPRLSPKDGTILKEGMVVTVEPGIYIPGYGGVRIEDMVVVTSDGCRNLASSPK